MLDSFTERLRLIRVRGAREAWQSLPIKRRELIRRTLRTEQSLRFRERIQEIIDDYSANLIETVPAFVTGRGFYDSMYALTVSANEEKTDRFGRTHKLFSRVTFFLSPRPAEQKFDIQCKLTVRSRDLGGDKTTETMADNDLSSFRLFVERQFIRFAEAYFDQDDAAVASCSDKLDPRRIDATVG